MLTVRSTINIASQTVPPIIPVVQGDTGRAILFTLADFTIPAGATATYYVQKPSGEAVYNNATIDGNNVLVELTAQSIIEKGDNYGQVRIAVGEDIVTSFDFILLVKEFRGIDAVQSLTEMNIFDKAVEQAADAIDEVKTDALDDIGDAKEAALQEIEQTTGNFADDFSASATYAAGDYVMHSGQLYRFTANHAAGAWTGSDAEAVTVGEELTDLKAETTELKDEISNTPFDKFYNHISNPLVKTSIKMVGNSITAGLGGTGYSATDETIIGSSQKTNVKTAICWANMLYHYLIDNFAGEKIVEANDPRITISGMYQINMNVMKGSQQITYHSMYTSNTVAKKRLEFDFYGTDISVIYSKAAVYGIFDIYVDGEKKQSVDCYASSTEHGTVLAVDGLSDGNHTIAIYSTDTKNDASSGKQFYVHGFIVDKSIEWHNYGISGSAVSAGVNTNGRYTNEDDFVFIMYGTNNRVTTATYRGFITEYKQLYDLLVDTYGITPIIISPPPVSEAQDTTNANTTYMFHTYDLQMAIREIADYYKVPFIDVYNGFLEYADNHDITYTTLLVDGLHPNNNGYNVIYHKVIKALGLPLMPSYKEWYQPT